MSEVIKAVGTVVGAVVGTVFLGAGVGTILGAALGSMAGGAAGDAIFGRPQAPAVAGSVTEVIHEVNAPAPYVMGEGLVAGVERWRCAYGATLDGVPNPYLALQHDYCVGGPVESITPYVDQAPVTSWYSGYLTTNSQLGACPESAALLPTGWGGYPAKDSTSKLSGKAAIMWNMKFDRDGKRFASGLPALAAYGQWVKVYDPRLDSTRPGGDGPHRVGVESTYTYSDCPALHAGTYAYGRFQNGHKVMGVGLVDDAIFWDVVAAWANVCEANGWTIFGRVTEPGDRWANLQEICLAGGGRPALTAAGLLFLYWAPKVSLDTITEADLADDDMAVTPMTAWRDRLNTLIPKYRSPDHKWEMVAAAKEQISTFVTEDGGERSTEWPFNLVKNAGQAAQLGVYKIWETREIQPIEISVGPRLRKYRPGECLWLNLPSLGLDIKAVIMKRSFDPARMVTRLTLMSETDAKHPYALGRTGSPPPTPALGQTAEDRDKLSAAAQAPSGYVRSMISSSSTNPASGILTAIDAGTTATINITGHSRVYSDLTVTVAGGTINGLDFATTYYVFYDDALREGGSVVYGYTTDVAASGNSDANPGRHAVGSIITPADGAASTTGGGVYDASAIIAGVDWSIYL